MGETLDIPLLGAAGLICLVLPCLWFLAFPAVVILEDVMSEMKSKNAAGHVPPEGMVNVSGRQVTEFARRIVDLLEQPFSKGMQADVAAHVLVCTAVDLCRANYGDERVAETLKRAIDRRLEKPMEYWGSTKGKADNGSQS